MDLTLTVPQLFPVRTSRRAASRRRARTRTGGSMPEQRDEETPSQRVVTFTAMTGTPVDELAASVAAALSLAVVDSVIPERVADALGVPVEDARAMDGVMPSKLAMALAWSGTPGLTADIDGILQAVRSLERYHETTQEVIRAAVASPNGALVVGRGAAFLLAALPRALHVYVDAPSPWRAAAIGSRAVSDGDDAQARYVRRAYRAVVTAPEHYGLVLDASVDDIDTMVNVVVAEAARRGLSLVPTASAQR